MGLGQKHLLYLLPQASPESKFHKAGTLFLDVCPVHLGTDVPEQSAEAGGVGSGTDTRGF